MTTTAGPWLGVVADDVTGACDTAGVVSALGVPTVVLLGVPEHDDEPAAAATSGCAVVALTTRTAPVDVAVSTSVAAGRWLLDHGTQRLYQKYCSTFDSTTTGNIGPIADGLADLVSGTSAGTPATPAVGRTVYLGHLFVDGRLVSESPLRDHPLTPMTDPDLVRHLSAQTRRPVTLVSRQWFDHVRAAVDAVEHGHVLLDAVDDADLDVLADALLPGEELLAGASGLAAALVRRRLRDTDRSTAVAAELPPVEPGGRIILAGSCSRRTREQIAAFPGPTVRLDVDDLADDAAAAVRRTVPLVADGLRAGTVLVTTSLDPEPLREVQRRHGRDHASLLAENALAEVARFAVHEAGVRRVVVAGGETSGAVTRALGVRQVHVGEQVAPGVPWTVSVGEPALALLLKSGNFGSTELFTTAWERCPGRNRTRPGQLRA